MPEEFTSRELGMQLKTITKSLEQGFKTTHAKQDKTNSKVILNTGWRMSQTENLNRLVQDRENRLRRYTDLVWKVAVIAIGLFLGVDKLI